MVITATRPGLANNFELEALNPTLVKKVDALVNKLRHLGAFEGAKRLELVSQEFKKLTIEEAYHVIAPDMTRSEVEELYMRKLGILHILRNALSLCPLILTWTALLLAAINYQQVLANPKYRDVDQYRPFLRLWQEGFHNTTWLTFSNAALGDVILLSLVLLFVILIIPLSESVSQSRVSKIALELEDVTDGLIRVVGKEGINPITSEADVDKVVHKIKQTVETTLLASKQTADQAKQFIADSEVRVTNVVGDFHKDLATFNADLLKLTSDLQSYGQTIQDLSNTNTQLASSSTMLVTNARDMATSATASAQASQGIGAQLNALNTTQQQMVNEISTTQKQIAGEIATTQQQVVKGITNSADIMDTVAKDTRLVAKELGQITQADLQSMTNQVTQVANQVNKVATSLSQIDQQLQATTQVLHQAAQALALASGVRVRKRRFLFF